MNVSSFSKQSIDSNDLDGFRVTKDPVKGRGDIILDRPPYNVISIVGRDQLAAAFAMLDADDDVRVIVLRAAGNHFCSGGNIAGFLDAEPDHLAKLADNIAAPWRCRKPVIAAIKGYCFGVGFELSLACDFRIAGESALFALPEMRLGMIPGSGGSARLAEIIGITRTKDLVMRAKRISGKQAEDWAIVTECIEDAKLESTVDKLVADLVEFSPLAQTAIKRVLNSAAEITTGAAIELEGSAYGRLRSSHDFREGVMAFVEKRAPVFIGS